MARLLMAVIRTIDPYEALIEIMISPGCEDLIAELLESLTKVENLRIDDPESKIDDCKHV